MGFLFVERVFFFRLVGSLAYDSSSALVRLAVVDGLCTLLANPLSHAVLKAALPMIGNLLHDR
jgi:hypothetical protein